MKKIELPKGWNSWSEVYANLENLGLLDSNQVTVLPRYRVQFNPSDSIEYKSYSTRDIKEMLLEELWEEKKKADMFTINDLHLIEEAIAKIQNKYIEVPTILKKVHQAIDNLNKTMRYKAMS